MWLIAIFLAVPLVEIALFIRIGGWLTLWPSLGIVVATGLLGVWILRRQGMVLLRELQTPMRIMRDPLSPLANRMLVLLAGLLLVLPGFLTDTVGLLLLVPGIRRLLILWLAGRVQVSAMAQAGPRHTYGAEGDIPIDGDYIDLDAGHLEPGDRPDETLRRGPGGPGGPQQGR